MEKSLKEIAIIGLWGERNYRFKNVDGNLILVGENGSGKSTVLRIIFYVLSKSWRLLALEDFAKIEITIGEDTKVINKGMMEDPSSYLFDLESDEAKEMFPRAFRMKLSERGQRWIDIKDLKKEIIDSGYSRSLYRGLEQLSNKYSDTKPDELEAIELWLDENQKAPVLYLPTFRRSEQLVNEDDIEPPRFGYRNHIEIRKYTEVTGVGMSDVDRAIRTTLQRLRDFNLETASALNIECFKGILIHGYDNKDDNSGVKPEERDPEFISMVFNSVSNSSVFSDNINQIRERLLDILAKKEVVDEYDKIVLFFYRMLVERYSLLKKKEEPLEQFFYSCNKYLSAKRMKYIPNEFDYSLLLDRYNGDPKTISLDQLSSGEKQVVALFGYLCLLVDKPAIVLIDEPELSLSVEWQERILEDVSSNSNCNNLIVATQSPFVYNNSLREDAHAIEEYLELEQSNEYFGDT